MLLGWACHELTNQADGVTEVWPGDGQVYEASDYLSEPFRVADLSGVGAKLHGSVQRSRDGLTIYHPDLEEHTQHVMSLVDQYAFGGADHFDLEKVKKVLHVRRYCKLELYTINFT